LDASGQRDTKIDAAKIIAACKAHAEAMEASIHLESASRLIFSLPVAHMGETWVSLWAATHGGYNTLGVVDERH
jgi:hypothetical protein